MNRPSPKPPQYVLSRHERIHEAIVLGVCLLVCVGFFVKIVFLKAVYQDTFQVASRKPKSKPGVPAPFFAAAINVTRFSPNARFFLP